MEDKVVGDFQPSLRPFNTAKWLSDFLRTRKCDPFSNISFSIVEIKNRRKVLFLAPHSFCPQFRHHLCRYHWPPQQVLPCHFRYVHFRVCLVVCENYAEYYSEVIRKNGRHCLVTTNRSRLSLSKLFCVPSPQNICHTLLEAKEESKGWFMSRVTKRLFPSAIFRN